MNDEERELLDAWVGRLVAALELEETPFDIDAILDLAGAAARSVVRPAAPLTTFIVGYSAGLAASTGRDPERAMQEAIGTATLMTGRD